MRCQGSLVHLAQLPANLSEFHRLAVNFISKLNMYSQEQVKQIKAIIASYLDNAAVMNKIKSKIKDQNIDVKELDDRKLLELLRDTDLFDKISKEMKAVMSKTTENPDPLAQVKLIQSKRALLVKVGQGRAFLNYVGGTSDKKLQFYVNFLKQRYASTTVNASVEPYFNENFIFDLTGPEQKEIDLLNLSKLNLPLEIVLISHNADGTKTLLSVKHIDWRYVLCHGGLSLSLELPGNEVNNKMSIGIIQISMDLIPKIEKSELLPDRIIDDQINVEKKQINGDVMSFYDYSTEWWNEYKQVKPGFDKRAVKIYGEDEQGVYKPVFTFVKPLYGLKGIDSPFHAARFVSLIPYKKSEKPGGEKQEIWHTFNTFLSIGAGDCEDHASLLCSILLGFGMDAYVVVGYSTDGPHTWVLTRMITRGLGDKEVRRYKYWEPLSGQRYEQKDPRVNSLYKKVACVFNHRTFYANIQDVESAYHVDFNLENEFLWRNLSMERISSLKSSQTTLSLIAPTLNIYDEEDTIERDLKAYLSTFRKDNGLTCKFDDKLGNMLLPALANYELERTTGSTFGQEEFQNSIKMYIPDNHTFKAFPIQFTHRRTKDMFSTLVNAPIAEDIIGARGDSIHFAVKAKIYVYPENFHSVWVTIAVRYLEL